MRKTKIKDSEPFWTRLIYDNPVIEGYSPNRKFPSESKLVLKQDNIAVECSFKTDFLTTGGLGKEQTFCFGVVTYYPPLPLTTCTSIPTEISLEVALDMRLKDYEDLNYYTLKRSRRRKRQASSLIHDFLSREVILVNNASGNVEDIIGDILEHDQVHIDYSMGKTW